ncbi:MAG: LCP family protein [Clostridia bacterium]|nr:LCP family protein [Clostridia bacterium]
MEKNKKQKKSNPIAAFLWKNKRRRAKNLYFILTAFVVIFAVGMAFINEKLELIDTGDTPEVQTTQPIYDEEEIEIMTSIDSAGSLNDYLYQWANNGGTLYSSKNVLNVLLVGLDSRDALENGGRSDSLILVSLNKKTKKINMTSFFRDTWCHINVGGEDRYAKLNSSYFYGGPVVLIDTIEKNFKIDIDHYVAVDFSSFVDIINALGGITVEVQEYEANYINRTTKHTIESGPAVTLNGSEALVFARIRKSDSDSDVSRTRRQRQVIESFIKSATNASLSQLNDALDTLFKYVKTDMTKMQILSYGTQAITNGWVTYDIEQYTLSDDDVFKTGYVGSSAVVFMDFPLAAQRVQTAVYGDSNIELPDDRVKLFSFVKRFT